MILPLLGNGDQGPGLKGHPAKPPGGTGGSGGGRQIEDELADLRRAHVGRAACEGEGPGKAKGRGEDDGTGTPGQGRRHERRGEKDKVQPVDRAGG